MKYFSTFSGIGGFEIGIQRAFDKQLAEEQQNRQGRNRTTDEMEHDVLSTGWSAPLCVGYSEIDKYAIKVYERQFNGHKNYGDITKINADELPDFDCLVGGFPCQAFSIAGKRKGFDDTRGTLFFDLARILRAKQPRLFVFENVKGLLSHDNGQTFSTIISTLTELGYDCQWQVLNSKNFGVPQNRERIFIVGHLRGTSRPKVFPIGQNDSPLTKKNGHQISESAISGTLTATDAKMHLDGTYIEETRKRAGEIEQINQPKHSSQRVYDPSGIAPTITAGNLGGGKSPSKILQLNQPTHSNDRVYGTDGISPTLNTAQGGNRQPFIPSDTKIRRLTPVECERLQGFPDNWTALGVGDEPISDSQRYKQCGNAISVPVVEAVFTRIFNSIVI